MIPRKNLIPVALLAVLALLVGPVAYGQGTPDGDPPANEGVCESAGLMYATPGLYGLCVAFCEAQDHASLDLPITEEELDALEAAAPSGHILAAYNARKTETDPAMPCILVEEPCPCWTADELASIDGFDSVNNSIGKGCALLPGSFDQVLEGAFSATEYTSATAGGFGELFDGLCIYNSDTDGDGSLDVSRFFGVLQGTLTADQADACAAQVAEHAVAFCP